MLGIFFSAIVPLTTVLVRRLHDTGRSGWWVVAWLVNSFIEVMFAHEDTFASAHHQQVYGLKGILEITTVVACGLSGILLYFLVLPGTKAEPRSGDVAEGLGDLEPG